jgi:ECF sigma factor
LSRQVERLGRQNLEWRRSKVIELNSQGYSQPETARILQVSLGTVNRDLSIIRRQARDNLSKHITQTLPDEYNRCFAGLNQVLKTCWTIVNKNTDDRTKLQATAIINDCYKYIMELATNGVVIIDAIKYVTQKQEQIDTIQMLDQRIEQKQEAIEENDQPKTTHNGVF